MGVGGGWGGSLGGWRGEVELLGSRVCEGHICCVVLCCVCLSCWEVKLWM